MTCIGNGLKFTARAITEESGVKMLTFFGCMVSNNQWMGGMLSRGSG